MTSEQLFHNIKGHIKTVLTHKWYVFKYACKAGYVWRGITHDLSKFSPVEFFESVKYYTGTGSPIVECKRDKGYSLAWQHHKGHNSHHYEYWVDRLDDGGVAIKMPFPDVVELICDYIAAGKAYQKDKFTFKGEYEWWQRKLRVDHPKIHNDTQKLITRILFFFAEYEEFRPDIIKSSREFLNY